MSKKSTVLMGESNNEEQPASISMQYFDSETPNAQQTLVVLKKKVRYLALCFMILFTSFNAAQNLVQSLYKQQGYQYLGLSSLLVLYAVFAIFSLFAKYLMNNRSYRQIFVISSLGYASFIIAGVWVCACNVSSSIPLSDDEEDSLSVCSPLSIYSIVLTCSCLCGAGSATLWVGQGGYMEAICSQVESKKGELCGIFWSIRQSSHIIGNLSAMIILNLISNNIYFFIIMSTVLLASSVMFYFVLPPTDLKQSQQTLISKDPSNNQPLLGSVSQPLPPIRQQIHKVFSLMGSRIFRPFFFFIVLGGVTMAFSSGYLRNIIQSAISSQDEHEVGIYLSYVLICFGCFEYIGGKVSGKLADIFNEYYLAIAGTLIILFGLLLCFVDLLAKSYPLCFLIGIVFGFSDCYLNNISQVISNKDYKGQLEVFQAQRFVFSITSSVTQLCILVFSNLPEYAFLSVVFITALVCNFAVALFFHYSQPIKEDNLEIEQQGQSSGNCSNKH